MIDDGFFENHELRICSIERWREDHEKYTFGKLKDTIVSEEAMKSVQKDIHKQEVHLSKQDDNIDALKSTLNKTIIGVLATLVMVMLKLFLDVFILKK